MLFKNLSLLLFLFCWWHSAMGQDGENKKIHVLQLGYGFSNRIAENKLESAPPEMDQDNYYVQATENQYSDERSGFGPLFLRYEYKCRKHLSFGIVLGYSNYSVSSTLKYKAAYSGAIYTEKISETNESYTLGARLNYHIIQNKWIDPYIGLAIGGLYGITRSVWETNDPAYSLYQPSINEVLDPPVYLAASLGLRFYPIKSLGIYAELCLDKWSYFQGGMVFKFTK